MSFEPWRCEVKNALLARFGSYESYRTTTVPVERSDVRRAVAENFRTPRHARALTTLASHTWSTRYVILQ